VSRSWFRHLRHLRRTHTAWCPFGACEEADEIEWMATHRQRTDLFQAWEDGILARCAELGIGVVLGGAFNRSTTALYHCATALPVHHNQQRQRRGHRTLHAATPPRRHAATPQSTGEGAVIGRVARAARRSRRLSRPARRTRGLQDRGAPTRSAGAGALTICTCLHAHTAVCRT